MQKHIFKSSILLAALAVCALSACGKKPEPGAPRAVEGRAETQAIRNVDVQGYSGAGVANKVDGTLQANDERKKALDQAIDAQSNP